MDSSHIINMVENLKEIGWYRAVFTAFWVLFRISQNLYSLVHIFILFLFPGNFNIIRNMEI